MLNRKLIIIKIFYINNKLANLGVRDTLFLTEDSTKATQCDLYIVLRIVDDNNIVHK